MLSPESFLAQAPDLDRAHYPGDLGTMEMNLNALDHIARTSQEQGVHTGQPGQLKEIVEQAITEGHRQQQLPRPLRDLQEGGTAAVIRYRRGPAPAHTRSGVPYDQYDRHP